MRAAISLRRPNVKVPPGASSAISLADSAENDRSDRRGPPPAAAVGSRDPVSGQVTRDLGEPSPTRVLEADPVHDPLREHRRPACAVREALGLDDPLQFAGCRPVALRLGPRRSARRPDRRPDPRPLASWIGAVRGASEPGRSGHDDRGRRSARRFAADGSASPSRPRGAGPGRARREFTQGSAGVLAPLPGRSSFIRALRFLDLFPCPRREDLSLRAGRASLACPPARDTRRPDPPLPPPSPA